MFDKLQALEVAIEKISRLSSSKSTEEDFNSTRDYIYSIKSRIAITTICNLYQIITNIEITKQKL